MLLLDTGLRIGELINLKLEDDPKEPRFITTRIGIGYMFLKSR